LKIQKEAIEPSEKEISNIPVNEIAEVVDSNTNKEKSKKSEHSKSNID
jgi:hypothetical protein